VDAPLDASGILGSFGHVIRCGRVSGLEDAACRAPRACMEICRPGPVRLPALKGAPSGMLVRPTRSLDRLPLRSLAPSHIRRQPDDTGLCGRHRRIPVIFTLAQQRPSCARHSVGQRHSDQHLRLACHHPSQPGPTGSALPCGPSHHGNGPDDQQPPNVALAHLRSAAQPVLAAARMLSRREADLGGEVTPLRKGLHRRRKGGDRRRSHCPYSRDRRQPSSRVVGGHALAKFGIAASDLLGQPGDLVE